LQRASTSPPVAAVSDRRIRCPTPSKHQRSLTHVL
jgi:hypothetical protein